MSSNTNELKHGCCSSNLHRALIREGISRRTFLGGVGGTAFSIANLSWPIIGSSSPLPQPESPVPLKVKPLLTYETPKPRQGTSWRNWGGIHTESQAREEADRIEGELRQIGSRADFPLSFMPVSAIRRAEELSGLSDLEGADSILLYAAGGWTDLLEEITQTGMDIIYFVRHESGPVYLWYEIIHPRFLRSHTDHLAQNSAHYDDVVVDSVDEVLWRLRALAGLKNARNSRILAIGGPGGWSRGGAEAPRLAMERWGLDIVTVTYEDLAKLIQAAFDDQNALNLSTERTEAYLADRSISLETETPFVEKCFLLDQVFRSLMSRFECKALTINACMGTIMEVSKTAACLSLSTLNDDGYLAFCESDFVIIPAGILLSSISGKPPFFHNPTFPHDGLITLAHCTAPRRMDGMNLEPSRIVTHFESDFGAAPQVQFKRGQAVTLIDADFASERWLGFCGEIDDNPNLPICRSQVNLRYEFDSNLLIEEMRGFHWMMVYGDYTREVGYALRKTGIDWKLLA